ncbi:hypothetical protein PSP31121_05370 [Pandoraea sputorum]|uniref:Uncharacterized protein n=1 Tax=Pandoraea sputorum TaxID=93222 RepID=A0A5E5BK83_9BURK|nr:hypothetical protein PSP31121_05370 [Pandoraea sputorum]
MPYWYLPVMMPGKRRFGEQAARENTHLRRRHLDAEVAAWAGAFDALMLDSANLLGGPLQWFACLNARHHESMTLVRAELLG